MSRLLLLFVSIPLLTSAAGAADSPRERLRVDAIPGSNPIARDFFTADPAPLVVGDTVYHYAGLTINGESGTRGRLGTP